MTKKLSFHQSVIDILSKLNFDERESNTIAKYLEEDLLSNISADRKNILEESVLKRLATGEPWQYISGKAHFYGKDFKVSKDVLIPRMETEELVYQVLQYLPKDRKCTVVDIGTGSGVIALTIASHRPLATVIGVDISDEALQIAQHNAHLLKIENVNWLKMDFLDTIQWGCLPAFDFLVSNPPYIPESEKKYMSLSTIDFEPNIALFTQNDAMEFYQKLAQCAMSRKESVEVFAEINEFRGDEVVSVFENTGFKNPEILRDLQGKNRILKASKA